MWRRVSRVALLVAVGLLLGLSASVTAPHAQPGPGASGKKVDKANTPVDPSRELQAALSALKSAERHLARAAFAGNALNLIQAAQSELRTVLATEAAKTQRKGVDGSGGSRSGTGAKGRGNKS